MSIFKWNKIPKTKEKVLFPQRSSHTSISYKNYIYFFCGETKNSQITNTVIRYDLEGEKWKNFFVKDVFISCRRNHTTVLYQDKIYLFGGDDNNLLNDLYIFDLKKLDWEKVEISKDLPPPRRYHCSIMYRDQIFIFGGEKDFDTMLNDIYSFDLKEMKWTEHKPSSELPQPRRYSSMGLYKNSIYLFGGRDNSIRFNKVWEYNIEGNYWKKIKAYGDIPSRRASHTCEIFGSSMFIFGGMDGFELNELREFDLENHYWRKIETFGLPPIGRYWHSSCMDSNGCMYIYGGGNETVILDDFQKIQLRKKKLEIKDEIYQKWVKGILIDCVFKLFDE